MNRFGLIGVSALSLMLAFATTTSAQDRDARHVKRAMQAQPSPAIQTCRSKMRCDGVTARDTAIIRRASAAFMATADIQIMSFPNRKRVASF
jgi:hypothetical protein